MPTYLAIISIIEIKRNERILKFPQEKCVCPFKFTTQIRLRVTHTHLKGEVCNLSLKIFSLFHLIRDNYVSQMLVDFPGSSIDLPVHT